MYLLFDTETTGLDPRRSSLLTCAMYHLNADLKVKGELSFSLKHDPYLVSADALKVNKINLVDHDAAALAKEDVQLKLDNFFKKAIGEGKPLIPVGQNVGFDINFVKHTFPDILWHKVMDYHTLDTMVLAEALKLAGKLPKILKTSLVSLAQHFGIDTSDAHNAEADCAMTLAVLKKMLELIK